jgi:polyisoprenoid-binding protein YceI
MNRKIFAVLVFCLAPRAAVAADWLIDTAKSSIVFSGTHAGKDFSGSFKSWRGQISFDPARLAEAKAIILIDLASAHTGDKIYDGTLPQADWLAIRTSSQGRFETSSIKASGKNSYVAQGFLTLRRIRLPVTLPFTLSITGKQAVMQGQTSLNRLAYGIGKSSDAAGDWVSLNIPLTIKVVAQAQ